MNCIISERSFTDSGKRRRNGNKYRENKLLKDMAVSKKDIIYLKSGDKINIENGISMEFIYPFKQPDSEYKRFTAKKIERSLFPPSGQRTATPAPG